MTLRAGCGTAKISLSTKQDFCPSTTAFAMSHVVSKEPRNICVKDCGGADLPRRSYSETESAGGRGRLISAWDSFKHAWDVKQTKDIVCSSGFREAESSSGAACAERGREFQSILEKLNSTSENGKLCNYAERSVNEVSCSAMEKQSRCDKPRKVVSLLLRRKSVMSRTGFYNNHSKVSSGNEEERKDLLSKTSQRRPFRRVQSQLSKSVSGAEGGEGRRYLEYAAELDDESFEKLREFTRHVSASHLTPPLPGRNIGEGPQPASSMREPASAGSNAGPAENGIIGEICLEDFADDSVDDFEFLEEQSVDCNGTEFPMRSPRKSLRMDSSRLTWIGNESEFAAFFSDFGLDDILLDAESSDVESPEFNVEPATLDEWQKCISDHNRHCGEWGNAMTAVTDIRLCVDEFLNRSSTGDAA